jgi:colicin import membrane protein
VIKGKTASPASPSGSGSSSGGMTFSATLTDVPPAAPPADDGRECIPERYKKLGNLVTITVRDRRTEGATPTRCYYEIAKYNVGIAKKLGKPWRGAELGMRFYEVKWAQEKLGAATGADRAKAERALNAAISGYERVAVEGAKELQAKMTKGLADAQAQAADLKAQYDRASGKLKEELHAKQVAAERMAKSLEKAIAKVDLDYAKQRYDVAAKRVGAKAEELKQKAQERLDAAKKTYEDTRARLDAALAKLESELKELRKKLDAAIEQVESTIEDVEGAIEDVEESLDGYLEDIPSL